MSRAQVFSQRSDLHAGLHALSQPITVISLALTLAQSACSEAERTLALEAAIAECQRAMNSVRQMRCLLDEDLKTKLPAIGVVAERGTEVKWELGGAA